MRPIEILHLEDATWDAELVERELRRSGLSVEVHRVSDREEFEGALTGRAWDIVLLDHKMPGFGGRQALDLARSRVSGTPCILVTGSLDEETAVEYMKAGASDYVLKDRLVRIGPAIEAALEHAERQRQLARQQALLSQVLDSAPSLICAKDKSGRIVLANRATAEAFGAEPKELIGRTEAELGAAPSEVRARAEHHRQVVAEGQFMRPQEEPFTHPGTGVVRWFQVIRGPLSLPGDSEPLVLTVAVDITEARELAAQLQLSQRLESVGRLAGGLAHDFNNLLMVVMGNADLMLERCRLEEADRAAVEHIRAAGESGAALTRQLLAFGRQQELQTSIVDLDEVVSRAEPLLRGILPEGVELVARLAGDLGAIRADPGQLEQILINLVVNARDAMPDGGRLTLETANVDPSSETLAGRQPLREGRLVMLAVTDTGVGMDDGTKGRVFEPFFTTKEHTHGSGLGLASVYGIVEQSAGFIRLESEVGRGSRFEIYFPRISGSG